MTDALGFYTIRGLPAGQYVVTPSFDNAEFSPDTRRVTVGPSARNVNFTARLARLQSLAPENAGSMAFRVTGVPRKLYALETSTNLVEWTRVKILRMDENGVAEVKHFVNTGEAQRYFRLRRK